MKKIFSFIFILALAAMAMPVSANWSSRPIALDPGHGGSDPGAAGPQYPHEAALALRCAQTLQSWVQNQMGGTCRMTRSSDVDVSLSARRQYSISWDPWIFCSIHLNAFNGSAHGTETWYYWSAGSSRALADKVQSTLVQQLGRANRGVKQNGWTVITGASSVPAILTEALFVDNRTEWDMINDNNKDGFKKWARGHIYGFYDYLVTQGGSFSGNPRDNGTINGGGGSTTQDIKQKTPNLPNGTYRIACYNDAKYGLDITSASTANGANVQLWEYAGSKNQQFNVTFSGDHYNIKAVHSGKSVDLVGGVSTPGTNIQQYDGNGTAAQKWVLQYAGEGAYYIINNKGLYVDAKDGKMSNGTNVQGYTGNKSGAQKWFFVAVNGAQSIPDGDYQIRNASNFGYCLDVESASKNSGANVALGAVNDGDNQKWAVKHLGNGYYSITAKHSGMSLNVHGGGYKGYANIQQYPFVADDAASMWILKDAGKGSFYVVNKNGLFVDVKDGKMTKGTNIGGWCGNSSDAQKWKFVAVNGTQTIKDGYYNICSAKDNNFVLDVDRASRENEANVILENLNGGNNQKWEVKYLKNGYYSIVAAHSRKALDIYNGGIDNYTNIQQYTNAATTNEAQQWIIKDAGDGTYYIIHRKGLFVDIENGTIANGTNIRGHVGNSSVAQKFVFKATEVDKEAPVISDIKITNITSAGYTVTCTVKDNEKVSKVTMPTWSVANDQDDLVWHEATISGNTATCTIKTSDHKNESGNYITHIYAYDDVLNATNVSAGSIDVPLKSNNPDRIPNGTYRIACYSDTKYGLDVAGASTADEANVQIYEYTGGKNQQFNVTYTDGHYNLQAVHSGKNLDLYMARSAAGTNVQQYAVDGTAVQNWTLQAAGEGTFYIVNSNGLYMDVQNGTMANNTNVQGYTGNKSNAQKWVFIPVNGGQTIPDGDYQIRLTRDLRYCVGVKDASKDNKANVELQKIKDGAGQTWTVKYLGNGYYSIMAKHSGLSLNMFGGNYIGNPNALQYTYDEKDAASMWIIRSAGDSDFYIVSKAGRFLDVKDGVFVEGTNIGGWAGNSSDAQIFKFVAADGKQSIPDGCYHIRSAKNTDYMLDVENASTENKANVMLNTHNGEDSQMWDISYLGNGYYSIVAVHSDMALDMYGGGVTNKTNVHQYTNNAETNDAQQWILREFSDKVFNIINKKGLFLDVSGGVMAAGTNIAGHVGNGTLAQQWVLTDVNSGVAADVDELSGDTKTVEKVEYYNVNGQASDKLFEGFNIIVTTYDDGSKDIKKTFIK